MNEESLFAAALDLPSAERSAFLDRACPDPALRQRLRRLLDADDRGRGILDHTVGAAAVLGAADPPPTPLAAGQEFAGRFRLLSKIGEGGMGEVWAAEQAEPVRRRVAVKVVLPGFASARLLARFEQERQALALMNHPHIAQVFDAGVDVGRPFLVMELIDGTALTAYCDTARMPLRQRLQLFLSVCSAVQHAHQKGVVHRDLKPSNILVETHDGLPAVKVIDFGLAKAAGPPLTGRDVATEVGTVVGTLEYMSPEQADLNNPDVDTRSDIYSLGVVLYELLCGTVPHARRDLPPDQFMEMLRVIREDEPPRPSARLADPKARSAVAGELDWIAMKCLEKDRERRYETAAALAADVGRYLADESVLACPPSAGYRLRKFARRHTRALAVAAAFAALLTAAAAGGVGLATWALRERDRADGQRQQAEANRTRALAVVEQMLTRVGEARLAHVPQAETVRRDLLQDALRFYEEFLRERGDDPAVRAEVARASRRVGDIHALLGRPDQAEAPLLRAVDLLAALSADAGADAGLLNDLAVAHNSLGRHYHATQHWPEAEAAFQRVATLLDPAAGELPAPHRRTLAGAHANLILLYQMKGDFDKAEASFRTCRAVAEGLRTDDANDAAALTILAIAHQNLGLVHNARREDAETEAAYLKALDLYQQLARLDPDDVATRKRLASILNNLGLVYDRASQPAKARATLQQARELQEALRADYPKVLAFATDLAVSYDSMSGILNRSGAAEESLSWSAKAIDLFEQVLKQDDRSAPARQALFTALMGRGYALTELGRRAEAANDWRRAVEVSEGRPDMKMRVNRPFGIVFLGDYARAAAEVEALVEQGQTDGNTLYTLARVLAFAAEAAAADARLPAAERPQLADRYGGRAVALLRQAQAAGFFRSPVQRTRLKESVDLKRIATRADFQRLLAELDKAE